MRLNTIMFELKLLTVFCNGVKQLLVDYVAIHKSLTTRQKHRPNLLYITFSLETISWMVGWGNNLRAELDWECGCYGNAMPRFTMMTLIPRYSTDVDSAMKRITLPSRSPLSHEPISLQPQQHLLSFSMTQSDLDENTTESSPDRWGRGAEMIRQR